MDLHTRYDGYPIDCGWAAGLGKRTMGRLKRTGGFLAVLLSAATNIGQAKQLQITPLTLASGTVGASYLQTLSATGGSAPLLVSCARFITTHCSA